MTRDPKDIEELLPFLANETLDGSERIAVETAVAGDAKLTSELAALRAIRATMQAETAEAGPGELGLARLMRDIEREAQVTASEAANVVPLSRLRLWQVAAVLILGLGIGQAVLTSNSGTATQGSVDGFELASGENGPATASFRVIFAPETSEADLRNFLLDAGLEIVAGPSSLGFYDLAPLDDDEDRQTARAALAAAGSILETWEDLTE